MSEHLLHIHLDRAFKQSIPENLKKEISLQTGDDDPDKARLSFCGFVFLAKETYVFMPRGSNIAQGKNSDTELARLLFKCLTKYCRTSEYFLQREGKSTFVGNPQILPLITEIITDYEINGIYTSENSFYRKGFQGKTDWKKTICGVVPHIDNGEIIYPHLINRFTDSYYLNEVTKIHYSILHAIHERFGWLLSDAINFLPNSKRKIFNNSVDIGLIKSELGRVFNDSKIHTLKMLLRFLENDLNSGRNESIAYGFSDFQYVWEQMLKQALFPTHFFSDMPVPAYQDHAGREFRKDQKGQRVDLFLYEPDGKTACVIDAKYYDASSTEKAPGWPDLVKQFFYAKSLTAGNLKNQVSKVKNYFIFPGIPSESSPVSAYVVDSTGRLDSDFPPIECRLVSPEIVISAYVENKPLVDLRNDLLN